MEEGEVRGITAPHARGGGCLVETCLNQWAATAVTLPLVAGQYSSAVRGSEQGSELYCTVQYCTVLYCAVLYSTVLCLYSKPPN